MPVLKLVEDKGKGFWLVDVRDLNAIYQAAKEYLEDPCYKNLEALALIINFAETFPLLERSELEKIRDTEIRQAEMP